ncbi:MAG: hypothetical protein D6796_16890 [Caldilineae bacterium]|nr:MAG: hypothetical protein D6796_16890 [Caldilineae bacterium]
MTTEQPAPETTVCYRHPDTPTGLRCARCERFICARCARRTPVGYICPECERQQEDKFYTGGGGDYLIAVLIALPLSLLTAALFIFLIGGLGWFSWLIAFFAAPFAAGLIAEAVRWGVRKRRARYLAHVTAACLIVAVAPFLLFVLLTVFLTGSGGGLLGLVVPGILLFMGASTIMARLR